MVFPAHAGMSPLAPGSPCVQGRFPRTRGDEPAVQMAGDLEQSFSPHTRG